MAATERTLESLANRLLDLDGHIAQRHELDTREFVDSMKNENTKRKTKSDVHKVKEWLQSKGEERELHCIPPDELNLLLARLFLNIRKSNGKEYEPDSIRSIQSSIRRHLIDNDYNGDIIADQAFRHSRDVIASKRKHLKEQGLGNKRNRSDPFTDDELTMLRQKDLLGAGNPEALVNSIWLNNTIHFGLRGRQEHVDMLWGDVELCQTSSGQEYLAFTERCTKTRNGVSADPQAFVPKMFAQPEDPCCPVQLYKEYADHRPLTVNTSESRFYLATNPHLGKSVRNGVAWFLASSMGKNKLGQIAKTMSEKAGLKGRHTNHSGRKTCITKLLNANIPPTEVAQLSGHRNLMSLNQYNTVSLEHQQRMSTVVHTVAASGDSGNDATFDDDVTNEELIHFSQEMEKTMDRIESFERQSDQIQIVDLPIIQSPGGSLNIHPSKRFREEPEKIFSNCTFNGSVNIVFK